MSLLSRPVLRDGAIQVNLTSTLSALVVPVGETDERKHWKTTRWGDAEVKDGFSEEMVPKWNSK